MLGEETKVAPWFIIHFTENNGMAFGLEFAGKAGKYFLTIFRIVAVILISLYIKKLINRGNTSTSVIVCLSLIFAGAVGNIIDSVFYGVIFNDSYFQVASFFPADGGYSSIFQGKVVDMLYFPILKGNYPSWVPLWGGEDFIFFRPVFNVADASITLGIILLLIFNRHQLSKEINEE